MLQVLSAVNIALLFAIVLMASIVLLLTLKNDHRVSTRYFTIFCGFGILWIITNLGANLSTTESQLLIWSKLSIIPPTVLPIMLLLFANNFHEPHYPFIKRLLTFLFIPAAAVILTSPTKYNIVSVNLEDKSYVPGVSYIIFIIYFVSSLIFIGWILLKKRARSSNEHRSQINLILYGAALWTIFSLVSSLILPVLGINSLVPLSPAGTIFFGIFTGYAIIAKKLFDVRLFVSRALIFTFLLSFVFAVYGVVIFLLTQAFGTQQNSSSGGFVSNMFAALFIGFTFEPLRKWIQARTDRWLFKKEYEQQSVIKDLGKKLNDVVALDEALETVMQTITRVLHLRHAVTYVFQPGEDKTMAIKRVKQIGYTSSARLLLEDRDFTVSYFSQYPATRLYEDLKNEVEREQELIEHNRLDPASIRLHAIKVSVLKKLKSLDVSVAIPLQLNSQPIGLILLSEKLSGEAYSPQDLTLLELVGGQAISSIQKAKLYEGDQMKSEFVSIASHELLTPISAMEGYLSMILDENIGKIDNQARDYLTKVYTSAKRLSELIKDLLSVSRIESGKMKVDLQQLDIAKMISDTIDQLRFVAANKNLTVTYRKPTDPLPAVWADPDRTMQIMVNLVSNAIKYTPKGEVTITASVDKANEFVTVSVTDTGLGMSKAQMSHLFTKFYRVDTPQTTGIMGTGLGLYITKTLIEKMGGSITCKSEVGKGTTFTFSLPVFKVETSTAS